MAHTFSVELIGRGAHRHLQLNIPAEGSVCPEAGTQARGLHNVSVSLELPPALMVDPYELGTALPSDVGLQLDGNLDLERCCWISHSAAMMCGSKSVLYGGE